MVIRINVEQNVFMVLVFIQYKRRNELDPGIGLDSALIGQNSEKG